MARPRSAPLGFSLVEMMVSMALAAVVIAIATSAIVGINKSISGMSKRVALDSEGKVLMETLLPELQSAGGGNLRPWSALSVENNVTGDSEVLEGTDRLTVALLDTEVASCTITDIQDKNIECGLKTVRQVVEIDCSSGSQCNLAGSDPTSMEEAEANGVDLSDAVPCDQAAGGSSVTHCFLDLQSCGLDEDIDYTNRVVMLLNASGNAWYTGVAASTDHAVDDNLDTWNDHCHIKMDGDDPFFEALSWIDTNNDGVMDVPARDAATTAFNGGTVMTPRIYQFFVTPNKELVRRSLLGATIDSSGGQNEADFSTKDAVLVDNVYDLQFALGFDFKDEDGRIDDASSPNDEWLYNHSGDGPRVGVTGSHEDATLQQLRQIAVGIILGTKVPDEGAGNSTSVFDGVVRQEDQVRLYPTVGKVSLRNTNVFQ